MIVIDASVAVKWFVDENLSAEAVQLRNANFGRITVPDLFRVEVAGALVRRANIRKELRDEVANAIDAFVVLFEEGLIESAALAHEAVVKAARMAIDLGHPLKDCIYLALAQELNCELVTCDANFATKARVIWPQVQILTQAAG